MCRAFSLSVSLSIYLYTHTHNTHTHTYINERYTQKYMIHIIHILSLSFQIKKPRLEGNTKA